MMVRDSGLLFWATLYMSRQHTDTTNSILVITHQSVS